MEKLEEILDHRLHRQLQLIHNKNLYPFMDWLALEPIVTEQLVPGIADTISQLLDEKEASNTKLQAKLNQLSFGNDPERNKRIIELFNRGLSRGTIAKSVGMSKWGVSKALKRLGLLS